MKWIRSCRFHLSASASSSLDVEACLLLWILIWLYYNLLDARTTIRKSNLFLSGNESHELLAELEQQLSRAQDPDRLTGEIIVADVEGYQVMAAVQDRRNQEG